MKKRTKQKLALHGETLRTLQTQDLLRVAGGKLLNEFEVHPPLAAPYGGSNRGGIRIQRLM